MFEGPKCSTSRKGGYLAKSSSLKQLIRRKMATLIQKSTPLFRVKSMI